MPWLGYGDAAINLQEYQPSQGCPGIMKPDLPNPKPDYPKDGAERGQGTTGRSGAGRGGTEAGQSGEVRLVDNVSFFDMQVTED